MAHTLTLDDIEPLTHDTYRLRFDRPADLTFAPGQAADMAFKIDGIADEKRPFTFTSQPDDAFVEFVIKSYPDHDGVTARLPDLKPGTTQAQIGKPWGAIADKGPGTFIAGGAGITPFIPILRAHARHGSMNCRLIFANTSARDIILRAEWEAMDGLDTAFVTDDDDDGLPDGPVDAALLAELVPDFSGIFYLCGPPAMGDAVTAALAEHGVPQDRIVSEDKPSEDDRAALFEAA